MKFKHSLRLHIGGRHRRLKAAENDLAGEQKRQRGARGDAPGLLPTGTIYMPLEPVFRNFALPCPLGHPAHPGDSLRAWPPARERRHPGRRF